MSDFSLQTPTIVITSQTLIAGGRNIGIAGTYYLPASGSSIVAGGITQALSSFLNPSKYIIVSQTLVPGGPTVAVSGTIISLQSDGRSVVVEGTTEALSVHVRLSTMAVQSLGGGTEGRGRSSGADRTSLSSPLQYTGPLVSNGTVFTGMATIKSAS